MGEPRAQEPRRFAYPKHGLARMTRSTSRRQVRLTPEHPAIVDGRTIFSASVRDPDGEPVLKSGMNNRKIGREVRKGRWAGMPIYTLTLEERATCPASCAFWRNCYGNKMNWARRFRHGGPLEEAIESELRALQRRFPRGFVVRLHVLGDFFSADYAYGWLAWLQMFPALRVFGFTAWPRNSAIGDAVRVVTRLEPDRFWVRVSGGEGMRSTVTVQRGQVPADAVLCPFETGQTDTCGTCGLCWTTSKRIAFLEQ